MDIERLKRYLKNIAKTKSLDDNELEAAIWLAGCELAHHIDIPELQESSTITIVSGTPNYDINPNLKLDRILAAVFMGSTQKAPLEEKDRRSYLWYYRGQATSGKPFCFTYWKKQIWLYKIPDETGTLYFDFQKVLTDPTILDDNYTYLIYRLSKRNLFDEDSNMWVKQERLAMRAIRGFKGRVRPYKDQMELSEHQRRKVQELNELY